MWSSWHGCRCVYVCAADNSDSDNDTMNTMAMVAAAATVVVVGCQTKSAMSMIKCKRDEFINQLSRASERYGNVTICEWITNSIFHSFALFWFLFVCFARLPQFFFVRFHIPLALCDITVCAAVMLASMVPLLCVRALRTSCQRVFYEYISVASRIFSNQFDRKIQIFILFSRHASTDRWCVVGDDGSRSVFRLHWPIL